MAAFDPRLDPRAFLEHLYRVAATSALPLHNTEAFLPSPPSPAMPSVFALAANTDGIDGIEDNAGVFVMPDTLQHAMAQGRRVSDYLDRHDAYGYFSAVNDLLITGPTHTNVNDFRAMLVV